MQVPRKKSEGLWLEIVSSKETQMRQAVFIPDYLPKITDYQVWHYLSSFQSDLPMLRIHVENKKRNIGKTFFPGVKNLCCLSDVVF